MRNILLSVVGALLALLVGLAPAEAKKLPPKAAVSIVIDISSQSMSVKVNGWHYANWAVSTARSGYYTPRGSYRVQRMARVYYSRKYDNAPMPNSIFFKGGYAIHGSGHIKSLGRPASHGCVRLHPSNAAKLYSLVQKAGPGKVRITIVN
jgi:lipoprotein-anchoring transpeptidase ErfK/SrfK